ncbi:hypothetical protein K523DRAFT_257841, partial [Schizophyllum commune Tattone D]
TARCPHGRHVLGAIWIQANDLPASRQLSGYPPHMSNLCCHICWVTLQKLDNVDISQMRLRVWHVDKAFSLAWRNATSIKEQEELFRKHGIRWSELHRLPYFDAILCSTLDVMHMFFERMLPHHLRVVWGMHVDAEDGLGLAASRPDSDLSEQQVADAIAVLERGDRTALHSAQLREVHHDLANFRNPSSTQAPPKKPGDPSVGKLKASDYEVFGLVNLPTTLIRLWGGLAEGTREKRVLDNYMHLVKAIRLAIAPRTPEDSILEYSDEIGQYLNALLELFPGTSITPYQHMAAHLPLFLRAHGPTHSWRCWIVERMNFVLQSVHTNHRFGEQVFLTICDRHQLMHKRRPTRMHTL